MEIVKRNLTIDILKRIKELDDTYYAEIPFEWYERYNENNTVTLLINDNVIVGYLVIAGIEKELYDAFKNKVLIGDICTNASKFRHDSEYKYLSSCLILEEYRYKGYGSKMLQFSLEHNSGSIIGITISKDGFNLINKYMKHLGSIDNKVDLFEIIL